MPANSRDYQRTYWRQKRRAAIAKLGGRCQECGFDDPRALQIDHIEPHGRTANRWDGIRRALKGLGNVQLLCANCHAIKSWDEGVFQGSLIEGQISSEGAA